jgi:CheY-like chemotaxis protein
MSQKTPTIAIRLIGFPPKEEETFFTVLSVLREKGYTYNCLKPGSLQDPDIYIANADDIKALAILSDLHPTEARPALLIGRPKLDLPYVVMPRPIKWRKLFDLLDELIDRRALLLTTLSAFNVVTVPERRRRERLDLDLTDPDMYLKMRSQRAANGIMIVDKDTRLKDYVTAAMESNNIEVDLAHSPAEALDINGKRNIGLIMINTSIPDADPYLLCANLRAQVQQQQSTIIFLINKSFPYDLKTAEQVGCDGFLNKPLSRKVVEMTIRKFLRLN